MKDSDIIKFLDRLEIRRNKLLHNDDGPAVEWTDGKIEYYLKGFLHRTNGPAVIYPNGDKEWWINGTLHNVNGPAIDYKDKKEYFLYGDHCSFEQWNRFKKLVLFI